MADAAEVILEQALAHELLATQRDQFAMQARTDGLTGLANRTAWMESLRSEEARRARAARSLAVMMADVDHLKLVNDEYGHAAGDKLLITTADVLREATRAGDLVARLGGDEFGILALRLRRRTTKRSPRFTRSAYSVRLARKDRTLMVCMVLAAYARRMARSIPVVYIFV